MSLGFIVITFVEVSVGLFLIWGFWHEDKMVEFEDKLFARLGFKRRRSHTAKVIPFNNEENGNKHCI